MSFGLIGLLTFSELFLLQEGCLQSWWKWESRLERWYDTLPSPLNQIFIGGCYKVDQAELTYEKAQQQCPKTKNGNYPLPTIRTRNTFSCRVRWITSFYNQLFFSWVISESFPPQQQFWIGYKSDGTKWTFEDNVKHPHFPVWTSSFSHPIPSLTLHRGRIFTMEYSMHTKCRRLYWIISGEIMLTSFPNTSLLRHAGNGKAPYPSVCEMAPCSVGYSKCNEDWFTSTHTFIRLLTINIDHKREIL